MARQAALAPVQEEPEEEEEEEDEDQEEDEEVSKLAALQEEVLKASLEYLKDD
jgi:hypothetical protein